MPCSAASCSSASASISSCARHNPRGNLRPDAVDRLQFILARREHRRRRAEPLQQRLPQQRPHARHERQPHAVDKFVGEESFGHAPPRCGDAQCSTADAVQHRPKRIDLLDELVPKQFIHGARKAGHDRVAVKSFASGFDVDVRSAIGRSSRSAASDRRPTQRHVRRRATLRFFRRPRPVRSPGESTSTARSGAPGQNASLGIVVGKICFGDEREIRCANSIGITLAAEIRFPRRTPRPGHAVE